MIYGHKTSRYISCNISSNSIMEVSKEKYRRSFSVELKIKTSPYRSLLMIPYLNYSRINVATCAILYFRIRISSRFETGSEECLLPSVIIHRKNGARQHSQVLSYI